MSIPEEERLWFESVSSLNRSLLLLEKVPAQHRDLIAQQAYELAKSLRISNEGSDDPTSGGYDRVKDMMKLKASNRWFSTSSPMQKALNEIYSLPIPMKEELGLKLLLSIQAIDQFSNADASGAEDSEWNRRLSLHQVIKSVFNHDLQVFSEQGKKKKQDKLEKKAALQAEEEETLALLEKEWELLQSGSLAQLAEQEEDLLLTEEETVLKEEATLPTMSLELLFSSDPPCRGSAPEVLRLVRRQDSLKLSGNFVELSAP